MFLVTRWFNTLEESGLQFPSNFDIQFFIKGIKVALDMEHAISSPAAINLLYKTFHYLPITARN